MMTLRGLLLEMAHAAQLTANEMAKTARSRFLREFDDDGKAKMVDVAPGDTGVVTSVPRVSLRDHHVLGIDEVEIEVETDVALLDDADTSLPLSEGPGNVEVHLKRRGKFGQRGSTNSHMVVKARFSARQPPEGVARVMESLDEVTGRRIHNAATTVPVTRLTPAKSIEDN